MAEKEKRPERGPSDEEISKGIFSSAYRNGGRHSSPLELIGDAVIIAAALWMRSRYQDIQRYWYVFLIIVLGWRIFCVKLDRNRVERYLKKSDPTKKEEPKA